MKNPKSGLAHRFRGYLPVVIDVETGGFNHNTDALLEIAAVILHMDDDGILIPGQQIHHHVMPFPNANIEQAALDFTGIDPYHPFRGAVDEVDAIKDIFSAIRLALKEEGCNVLEKIDDSEYGKFAWVIDPEGNKVELWQPPQGQ